MSALYLNAFPKFVFFCESFACLQKRKRTANQSLSLRQVQVQGYTSKVNNILQYNISVSRIMNVLFVAENVANSNIGHMIKLIFGFL